MVSAHLAVSSCPRRPCRKNKEDADRVGQCVAERRIVMEGCSTTAPSWAKIVLRQRSWPINKDSIPLRRNLFV